MEHITKTKKNHSLKVTNETSKNYSMPPSNKVINHLWAIMSTKFPNTWKATYSDSPFNSGLLTSLAAEWSNQLTGLSNIEIKQGIDNLSNRKEKRFPPNSMEFKDLCVVSDYENVLEEIVRRLQDGEQYKFSNQLAFNFWIKYSYDLLNCKMHIVPKLIKQNLKIIDKSSMFELPDYSVKAIEKTLEPINNIATKNERRIFQSYMCSVITTTAPHLFISDKLQDISERELNREPQQDLPQLMKKIFSKSGTLHLIEKFKNKNYQIPDKPIEPNFFEKNTIEYKSKFLNYQASFKNVIFNFMKEELIL